MSAKTNYLNSTHEVMIRLLRGSLPVVLLGDSLTSCVTLGHKAYSGSIGESTAVSLGQSYRVTLPVARVLNQPAATELRGTLETPTNSRRTDTTTVLQLNCEFTLI
jgi:hypothetical protein